MEFWIDGKTTLAGPGSTVYGPRDVPHCFRNPGDTPTRMLMIASPAGLEHFFDRLTRLAPEPPPPMREFLGLCAEFGIEVLPPT